MEKCLVYIKCVSWRRKKLSKSVSGLGRNLILIFHPLLCDILIWHRVQKYFLRQSFIFWLYPLKFFVLVYANQTEAVLPPNWAARVVDISQLAKLLPLVRFNNDNNEKTWFIAIIKKSQIAVVFPTKKGDFFEKNIIFVFSLSFMF